jgi:hypothetical protein
VSDRAAVETLASRGGRNLAAEGVEIVVIGGAQAIGASLRRFGPQGLDARLAGLCDAPEEGHFARALERAGIGTDLDRAGMAQLGFFVCDVNLEDELVRAVGPNAVLQLFEAQRELRSFRTYQKQPAHRDRPIEDQLVGFMWNRKLRYARLLVEALEPGGAPAPLRGLLEFVRPPSL